MGYRRVLVAVDPKANMGEVLTHALGVVERDGGSMTLLYVGAEIEDANNDAFRLLANPPELPADVKETLVALRQDAAASGVPAEVEVRYGPIVGHIAEAAHHHDVVVMGTHGRRGIQRLLVGSVAEGVLRTVHTPVLIVRQNG